METAGKGRMGKERKKRKGMNGKGREGKEKKQQDVLL